MSFIVIAFIYEFYNWTVQSWSVTDSIQLDKKIILYLNFYYPIGLYDLFDY